MLIAEVDNEDRPLRAIRRQEVFRRRANFRVSHIFLLNARHELLLQLLPPHHKRHPGYWGSSVAAYVSFAETYRAAAARRLRQELGVPQARLELVGKLSMIDQGSKKFIHLYTCRSEGPFSPDPAQIERLEFMSFQRLLGLREGNVPFTPTFLVLLDYFLSLYPPLK